MKTEYRITIGQKQQDSQQPRPRSRLATVKAAVLTLLVLSAIIGILIAAFVLGSIIATILLALIAASAIVWLLRRLWFSFKQR